MKATKAITAQAQPSQAAQGKGSQSSSVTPLRERCSRIPSPSTATRERGLAVTARGTPLTAPS